MNKKEKDVLNSLCNGDISFTEAVTLLEISEEKIEELLGKHVWTPSPEKLSELRDIAMENFRYIELEIQKEKLFKHVQIKNSKSTITFYLEMAKQVLVSTKKFTSKQRG